MVFKCMDIVLQLAMRAINRCKGKTLYFNFNTFDDYFL